MLTTHQKTSVRPQPAPRNDLSDIRTNFEMTNLHTKAADLLRRISTVTGDLSTRDKAMARIYADQLERRQRRSNSSPQRNQ